MNNQELVSIIIPVYNTEDYLDKCLSSILNQTYKNIEVIIIDDSSTDNSYKILQKFQNKDKRIILLQQKNSGQGVARNKGIKISKGKYIFFVDSDDRITKDMVKEMVLEIEKTKSDFSSFLISFEDSKSKRVYKKKFNNRVLKNEEIYENALEIKDIFPIPVNKIYRRNFLIENNIYFPEIRKNEDILFIHKLAFFSRKCSFNNKIFYYAWKRNGSTSRDIKEENIKASLKLLTEEKEFLLENKCFEKFELLYKVFYVRVVLNILLQSLFYKSKKIKKIKNTIEKSDFNNYLLNFEIIKKLPIKQKIVIFLYKINCLEIIVKMLNIFKFKIY